MGLHMFSFRDTGGVWNRTPHIYDDQEFYRTVDLVDGYIPFNMSAFHFERAGAVHQNRVMETRPEVDLPIAQLFRTRPSQPMKLKDKLHGRTIPIVRKYGDYVLTETEYGQRFWQVDGQESSIITKLLVSPISLREASSYVDAHHRHNAGPSVHKFSVCLRVPGEPEPVGVAIASLPKARHKMDGVTLEINRVCVDGRYADACSLLYARLIRAGRALGYRRFITYTLPQEPGASLRAVGFHVDGIVAPSRSGWNCPSRPRETPKYPAGDKLRWVLE